MTFTPLLIGRNPRKLAKPRDERTVPVAAEGFTRRVPSAADRIVTALPFLDEVSIGHAIISRAVFVGLATVVREYLDVLKPGRESM